MKRSIFNLLVSPIATPFVSIILISFHVIFAQVQVTPNIISSPMPDPTNSLYTEQISCDPENCIMIIVQNEKENEIAKDTTLNLLRKKASKVVIDLQEERYGIGEDRNKIWREYVREIAKRDGMVVFEPFYMGARSLQITDIPILGDYFRVGWNIYTRMRSYFLYSAMKDYNAKVLYHPQSLEIMMIYFVHKDFGSICETFFSNCNVIDYLDDDIFDLQLQKALEKYPVEEILIRFNQTEAMLPLSSIQIDAFLGMNRSARLYKWLIAMKVVEKKPDFRERYMSAQTALMIIDYSLASFDLIQAMRMYACAKEWKAIVYYTTDEFGEKFRSVHLTKIQK